MFNLKAKHMNKGAGVAHMWLKWLRELRRVLGLDEPQKLPGEQPMPEGDSHSHGRQGRVWGGLLTAEGLHAFIIRWSPHCIVCTL